MTFPEYRYYARAVVERNHLQSDTAILRAYAFELRESLEATETILKADSLTRGQMTQMVAHLEKSLQAAQDEARRAKKRVKLWRGVAFVTVALLPVVYLMGR